MALRFGIFLKTVLSAAIPALGLAGVCNRATAEPAPLSTSWTRIYFGVHAGHAFGGDDVSVDPAGGNVNVFQPLQQSGAVPTSLSPTDGTFIAGAQLGADYQVMANVVVGLAADISWLGRSSQSDGRDGVFPPNVQLQTEASRTIDFLGTLRARAGYLVTPDLLVYGTGGLAYGRTELSLKFRSPVSSSFETSISDTKAGWVAGVGVEWFFMPNVTTRVEFLHYDLGSLTTSPGTATIGASHDSISANSDFDGNIVRAAVSFRLN